MKEELRWLNDLLSSVMREKALPSVIHLTPGLCPRIRIEEGSELVELENREAVSSGEVRDLINCVLSESARDILREFGEVEVPLGSFLEESGVMWVCNIFSSQGRYRLVIRRIKDLESWLEEEH